MHPFPHTYIAVATGGERGTVDVTTTGAPTLITAPPVEFDGPGDRWSPESLLCAAVADCFILTFRALARASQVKWLELKCRVEGKLDRVEGKSRFTHFTTHAEIAVEAGSDIERFTRLLEKAEHGCLISNSLCGERSLETRVTEVAPATGTSN